MENNSRQLLFWHWRVSQHRKWKPTSDWLIPKEDEIKKKKQNISNSWQPLTFLHEQSRSRQQMHSITVCHLREGWTNNVTTKRQGPCLFPFSCLFESYRKSRVKSPRNKVFIKAAIKGLLWSLFGHDYFYLNLQAVRVGGLTQSFKYASKRHCYDNIIFASIFQISFFLSIEIFSILDNTRLLSANSLRCCFFSRPTKLIFCGFLDAKVNFAYYLRQLFQAYHCFKIYNNPLHPSSSPFVLG